MKRRHIAILVFLVGATTVGIALLIRGLPEFKRADEPSKPGAAPNSDTGDSFPRGPFREPVTETGTEDRPDMNKPSGAVRIYAHAAGVPLAHAQVLLFRIGVGRRRVATGLDGSCLVKGLRPGKWEVGIRHLQYMPVHDEVEVVDQKTAQLTLELKQGARVWGRVTDANHVPIVDAKVRIFDPEKLKPVAFRLESRTDGNGVYEIDGIPVQEVVVYFTSAMHKPARKNHRFTRAGESFQANATLTEGNVVGGSVETEGGAPIVDALVTGGNKQASAVRTDEQGKFTIYGLGDGLVNLSVSKPGYGTQYRRNVEPNTTDLVIRLPQAGSISGRVVADEQLKRFSVVLTRYDEDFRRDIDVQTKPFHNDGRGHFSMKNVGPGPYKLRIVAKGYVMDGTRPINVVRGQDTSEIIISLRRE